MTADPHQQLRHEIGVYVLGALEPAERERVERHLSSCATCRDEVSRLAVLPSLLSRVGAEDAEGRQSAPPLEPVLGRIVTARRRARRRLRLRAAAAMVAAVALTALASVAVLAPGAGQQDDSPQAQLYATDDGATRATVEPRAWGMAVQIEAADLPPSSGYAALAVAGDGHRTQVASWSDVGHDVTVDGSCYLPADEVQRLEIVSSRDDRVVAVLTPSDAGDDGPG